MYYEVRQILNGFVVYRGKSETSAATKLEPGRCYGKGLSLLEAHQRAAAAVQQFQKSA